MDRAEAAAFGRFLRDAGLVVETINMPSLDQNLASASAEMRDYTVRLFERLIAIAEDDRRTWHHQSSPAASTRWCSRPERNWRAGSARPSQRVLRTAERAGVRLMLENIPMGVYPRAEQLIAFAESIGSPAVGICYDIANAHFIGEDAAAGLHAVQSRLDIVHLSDTGRDAWRHDPVGRGSCDFAAFGAALQEIGYAEDIDDGDRRRPAGRS